MSKKYKVVYSKKKVVYSKKAEKQLKKLDKFISRRIVSWVDRNLHGRENPYFQAKGSKVLCTIFGDIGWEITGF